MRFSLKHQNIGAAGLRQVISDARPDDAAADDDDVCGFHKAKVRRKWEKVKKALARPLRTGTAMPPDVRKGYAFPASQLVDFGAAPQNSFVGAEPLENYEASR